MLQQGTDEWRMARVGSVGASDAPKVVRRTKTGYSADRANLMADKLLERLTNRPVEIYKSPAMLRGLQFEPEARLRYMIQKNVEVEEAGLDPHPRIKGAHASPDGIVAGGFGLVEIKCPLAAAHLDTLLTQSISNDYIVQMQWQMACTGRPWVDYVSYNPDFPPAMQLWVQRVLRDPPEILNLEGEITRFVRELEQKLDKLQRSYGYAEAA
jgi:putative phage-type endonuclease